MKSFGAFLLVSVVLAAFIIEFGAAEHCDCDYHPGGCVISEAPPAGWKCKCRYKGAWTCDGLALQCDSNENCPADCSSKECCKVGGGDCDGY